MKPKKKTEPAANPAEKDWTSEREAAANAAFSEVRQMTDAQLARLLENTAADHADMAGDIVEHDGAMPDLLREAACLYVAAILRRCSIRQGAFAAWRKEAEREESK
jgi:hypothetical protein